VARTLPPARGANHGGLRSDVLRDRVRPRLKRSELDCMLRHGWPGDIVVVWTRVWPGCLTST
jgi:hypothetical protein